MSPPKKKIHTLLFTFIYTYIFISFHFINLFHTITYIDTGTNQKDTTQGTEIS